MELLDDRGYVYNVYDLGDGRVLKEEKPIAKQYALHLPHGNSRAYVDEHKARGLLLIGKIVDPELLGNPMRAGGTSYTQDKVTILEEYIDTHDLAENKKIVDLYIQSVFETWKNGFSDIIFNFSHNAGVHSSGRVILLDFNEVTFDKGVIAERLNIKRWLRAHSYKRRLPEGPLKEYYADAMEKAMTIENLNLYWKDNEQLLE